MSLDVGGFPLAGTPFMVAPDGTVTSMASALTPALNGINFKFDSAAGVVTSTGVTGGNPDPLAWLFNYTINGNVLWRVSSDGNVYARFVSFTNPGQGTNNQTYIRGIAGTSAMALFSNGDWVGDFLRGSLTLGNWAGGFGIASNTTQGTAADVMFTRGGAATWQQGNTNAAAPVNQTLQAQGARPGTDVDVAGANYTISSGLGTGIGARSVLNLASPVKGVTGSAQQVMTTGLKIDGGTAVSIGYTVATLPATPLTGARAHVTDATATTFMSVVAGGGANTVPVFYNGANWVIG